MLYIGTTSSERPSVVAMDEREDGSKIVRITADVKETENEDGQAMYQYNEVVFELEAGRTETITDIEASIEDWWEYGSQPEEPAPTIEERVAMLEDFIISGGEI